MFKARKRRLAEIEAQVRAATNTDVAENFRLVDTPTLVRLLRDDQPDLDIAALGLSASHKHMLKADGYTTIADDPGRLVVATCSSDNDTVPKVRLRVREVDWIALQPSPLPY